MIAGSEWVVIVAGGLVALAVLYMIAVAAAPPKRVALRRVAHTWPTHEVGTRPAYR
jgi:NaMN:DMB phosphoribosyltransferase